MKKTFVFVVLFALPLVAYLFFATGVQNFGRLPILDEELRAMPTQQGDTLFDGRISIVGFLGSKPERRKGQLFNLNMKIYRPFRDFNDFQIVMIGTPGTVSSWNRVSEELGKVNDISGWKFTEMTEDQIRSFFGELGPDYQLEGDLGSPFVFIVDKDQKQRGRINDEDEGVKSGYDITSVAEINNKMEDDVKIILAEYRLALKKNYADRSR